MKKIMLVGEPMLLFMANECGSLEKIKEFSTSIAGAELNVAIGLSRLGYSCEYMTKLGNDAFGKRIKEYIKREKIGVKYIAFDEDNNTGIQIKSKVLNGDPETEYFRKNSAASKITKDEIDKIDFSEISFLHITGIPLGISKTFREAIYYLIEKAKENNIYISFDPNLRLKMWKSFDELREVMNDVSKKVDLILPGISECKILLGTDDLEEIKEKYMEMGIKRLILKQGEIGSHYIENGKHKFVKGFKVEKVVDTVGAGDGFAVGVISSILDDLSEEQTLERANAIGAIQVLHRSDNEGLPTIDILNEFIEKNRRKL